MYIKPLPLRTPFRNGALLYSVEIIAQIAALNVEVALEQRTTTSGAQPFPIVTNSNWKVKVTEPVD